MWRSTDTAGLPNQILVSASGLVIMTVLVNLQYDLEADAYREDAIHVCLDQYRHPRSS